MAISMAYLKTITDAVNMISGAGQNAAEAMLRRLIAAGDYANPHDLVRDALKELEPLFQAVSERTASISATSYDLLRSEALGEGMGAIAYPDRAEEWTRKAMYAAAARSDDDMDAFIRAVRARLDYEAKRAAGTTMFANGAADQARPRFARVPTGAETCPFCIMLASRGFVYWSSETAGNLDHYHSHCDCRVVPQFGGESYEGYDPDEYYEKYEESVKDGSLDLGALEESARRAKQRKKPTPRTTGAQEASGSDGKIASIRRGEPMGFWKADRGRANPHYSDRNARKKGYRTNCQSCVIANEMRRRGYTVRAKPRSGDAEATMKLIAHDQRKAWMTKDGRIPSYEYAAGVSNQRELLEWIDNNVKAGERYFLGIKWKGPGAHIVCLERDENNKVRLFCAQSGKTFTDDRLDAFLNNVGYTETYLDDDGNIRTRDRWPRLLRVDNLEPNPAYVNSVLEGAEA